MGWKRVCDECGKELEATQGFIHLATGYVLIAGEEIGQSCDLCPEHLPDPGSFGFVQPRNCERVSFYWPGQEEQNAEMISGDGAPRPRYGEFHEVVDAS